MDSTFLAVIIKGCWCYWGGPKRGKSTPSARGATFRGSEFHSGHSVRFSAGERLFTTPQKLFPGEGYSHSKIDPDERDFSGLSDSKGKLVMSHRLLLKCFYNMQKKREASYIVG